MGSVYKNQIYHKERIGFKIQFHFLIVHTRQLKPWPGVTQLTKFLQSNGSVPIIDLLAMVYGAKLRPTTVFLSLLFHHFKHSVPSLTRLVQSHELMSTKKILPNLKRIGGLSIQYELTSYMHLYQYLHQKCPHANRIHKCVQQSQQSYQQYCSFS